MELRALGGLVDNTLCYKPEDGKSETQTGELL
jgi:hypothetical protein